jgi:hypothetical protein
LVAWCALQIGATRSVERWRYDRDCARFARLLDGTRAAARELEGSSKRFAVIAPSIWKPEDYQCGVALFASEASSSGEVEWIERGEASRSALSPGGRLDPARVAVFTTGDDGRVVRITASELASERAWIERDRPPYAGDRTDLPVLWFALSRSP